MAPSCSSELNIAIWICLAMSVILFNKVIISIWDFNYPIFLTFSQSAFALIATQLMSNSPLNFIMPGVRENKISTGDYLTKVGPIALCFSVNIVCANKVYTYLSLGFIQMLKAMGPIPMLIGNILAGREKASIPLISVVLLVSIGVASTSVGELHFSWIGFLLQITSTLADATRCVLSDIILKGINLDPLSLVYYISPLSSLFLGLMFMMFEFDTFPFHSWQPVFMGVILLNCILVFALNIAVYSVLGKTSSMIMSLTGPLKDVTLISISYFLFASPVTMAQVTGYSVTLIGLEIYRRYKNDPNFISKLISNQNTKHGYCTIVISAIRSSFSSETIVRTRPIDTHEGQQEVTALMMEARDSETV